MSQSVKVPLLVRNGLMNFQKDLLVSKYLLDKRIMLFRLIDTHRFFCFL